MKVIDIYQQYFSAEAEVNGIVRRAVSVILQCESDEGNVLYRAIVNFFPYEDPEDWRITSDALAERTLYQAKGRRSRKREAQLEEQLRETADELAAELNGKIDWEHPLREARRG